MDVTTLTDAELKALVDQAAAEVQKRGTKQRLLDAAWRLVTDAKNNGYTKQQVGQALTDVVNQAYA